MKSRRIAVISQKGGSGKTTLAIHLAIAAFQDKQNVLVLDADPQGCAMAFATARDTPGPQFKAVHASEASRMLDAHEGLVIVDTPPHHASPSIAQIAKSVDLILAPCRPSVLDLTAMHYTARLITAERVVEAGAKAMIVLSACPPRAPEVAQIMEAMTQFQIPIAKTQLTERRSYSRAISYGQAVTEFEAKGKAAGEIVALWKEVKKALGIPNARKNPRP